MDDIVKEAGLGDNWQVVDELAIKPGQYQKAPPSPNAMANYFQGSISPGMQHDAVFVGTEYGTPRIPSISLMPIGLSGSAGFNSATGSFISRTIKTPVITPVITPTTGQFFEENGNGIFSLMYQINGVII